MNAMKSRLGAMADLPMTYLPVAMAANLYYSVTARAREARRDGEKGAVSIEQALITVAVIAFALVVLAAIAVVVGNVTTKVQQAPLSVPTAAGAGAKG
ncbi:hypothetical protein [Streptacidiphilus albus]|uniref:hypothetical protein n=1 Tax=Streptacidiphilus albus TaxID=105425 RepID=UPI000ADB363F|nr:hypothetical protein [Streptacidiphilus albus]